MMEDLKIKLLLKSTDGTIAFIEFMQYGKSKILSYENCNITCQVFEF